MKQVLTDEYDNDCHDGILIPIVNGIENSTNFVKNSFPRACEKIFNINPCFWQT